MEGRRDNREGGKEVEQGTEGRREEREGGRKGGREAKLTCI
jgi:hypothetical protein